MTVRRIPLGDGTFDAVEWSDTVEQADVNNIRRGVELALALDELAAGKQLPPQVRKLVKQAADALFSYDLALTRSTDTASAVRYLQGMLEVTADPLTVAELVRRLEFLTSGEARRPGEPHPDDVVMGAAAHLATAAALQSGKVCKACRGTGYAREGFCRRCRGRFP